jgi:hypothetical protein
MKKLTNVLEDEKSSVSTIKMKEATNWLNLEKKGYKFISLHGVINKTKALFKDTNIRTLAPHLSSLTPEKVNEI